MSSLPRVLLASLILALLPSFGAAEPALVTVRVGHPVTETATPLLYAMRVGLFRRAGINVELTKMTSGAAVSAALAGGALDVGGTSILALILGHARGVPFTIFAAAENQELPTTEAGLLVQNASNLREPKDFAGKTVTAAAVNDINALAMEAWMEQGGADPKSVKFVELPQSAAPAALEQGRVDGITLGAGTAFTTAMANPKIRFVANIFSAIGPRFAITAWFTSRDWIARNRSIAERFARVLDESAAYTNTHANETLRDLVDYTGIDPALAAKMKRATFTTTLSESDIQPVIDVAAKYRAIDKAFPASEIITDVLAKQ